MVLSEDGDNERQNVS